jgi:hypothetical protein
MLNEHSPSRSPNSPLGFCPSLSDFGRPQRQFAGRSHGTARAAAHWATLKTGLAYDPTDPSPAILLRHGFEHGTISIDTVCCIGMDSIDSECLGDTDVLFVFFSLHEFSGVGVFYEKEYGHSR